MKIPSRYGVGPLLAAIFLLLLPLSSSSGQTIYYISPSGNDGNAGEEIGAELPSERLQRQLQHQWCAAGNQGDIERHMLDEGRSVGSPTQIHMDGNGDDRQAGNQRLRAERREPA